MVGNTKEKECEEKDPKWDCPLDCPPIKNVTHPLVGTLSFAMKIKFLAESQDNLYEQFAKLIRFYEFTPEEMKALEECDKESFYQRCLPFSTVFAALTYVGVKNGFLKRSPHFGAVPKVLFAAFIGHIYGRLSYIPNCEIKLRHLPDNSHLGNVMRKYHLENNSPKEP
ncbi:unnamed protein product, partial [Brenthis ino]